MGPGTLLGALPHLRTWTRAARILEMDTVHTEVTDRIYYNLQKHEIRYHKMVGFYNIKYGRKWLTYSVVSKNGMQSRISHFLKAMDNIYACS